MHPLQVLKEYYRSLSLSLSLLSVPADFFKPKPKSNSPCPEKKKKKKLIILISLAMLFFHFITASTPILASSHPLSHGATLEPLHAIRPQAHCQ